MYGEQTFKATGYVNFSSSSHQFFLRNNKLGTDKQLHHGDVIQKSVGVRCVVVSFPFHMFLNVTVISLVRQEAVYQWCSNRGPQGPLEWPAKQFSSERKLNTLII